MNPENRAIKIHIKEMAPMTAIQKIEDYKIPTPYKEILIALVNRKEGYEALDKNAYIQLDWDSKNDRPSLTAEVK